MLRGADILDEPQVRARGLYSVMEHPLFDTGLPAETGPAPYRRIPPADLRPAPVLGEHTIELCQTVLSMDRAEIEHRLADGVLFVPSTPKPTAQEQLA
jgi:crotonobetainyl-CoA:carnitine CoA-transferase CaiB-like acyl-CoA transferase